MIKMPWKLVSSPHFVLEINKKCNLELHPQLCEIVGSIHKRNLKVVLVTNGLCLDDSLLGDLKRAGLDMILLHIDEGQSRPDLSQNPTLAEINSLRSTLAQRATTKNIDVGLSVTVYSEYLDRLPRLVDYILNSKNINFLFATNYVEVAHLVKSACFLHQNQNQPLEVKYGRLFHSNSTTNQQIYKILEDSFGLEPFAYLPLYDKDAAKENPLPWMTYFIPVVHFNDRSVRFNIKSNLVDSFLLFFSKLTTGRFVFYSRQNPFVTIIRVLCNTITSGRMIEGVRFLLNLRYNGTQLKAKRLLFENGPIITKNGDISCCIFCPNATVRGNRLVPVCLADYSYLKEPEELCKKITATPRRSIKRDDGRWTKDVEKR